MAGKYQRPHLRGTVNNNNKYDVDQQLVSSLEKHAGLAVQAKTIVVLPALNTPFFICDKKIFRLDDEVSLAVGCHALLSALSEAPSILKHAYRIELLLAPDKAGTPIGTLRMCISPTEWFDYLALAGVSEDARLKTAKEYIKFAHEVKKEETVEAPQAFTPVKNNKALCQYGQSCRDLGCRFLHPYWTCIENVPHKHGGNADCGFSTFKENIFPPGSSQSDWTMFTRPFEYTRELLVMPSPTLISSKTIPHDNVGMVQTPAFWAAIHACLSNITSKKAPNPCTRVVVNFGHWETAMRVDPYLTQCHAHAHLWLTPTFVRANPSLTRHDFPPEDYMLVNAFQLEHDKLFYHRLESIEAIGERLKDTEKSITGIKTTQEEQGALLKLIAQKLGIPT